MDTLAICSLAIALLMAILYAIAEQERIAANFPKAVAPLIKLARFLPILIFSFLVMGNGVGAKYLYDNPPHKIPNCDGWIYVPGNEPDGVKCKAPEDGDYTFVHEVGAYLPAKNKWKTEIYLYRGRSVHRDDDGRLDGEGTKKLFSFDDPNANLSRAAAEAAGKAEAVVTVSLDDGDIITLVAVDFGGYEDNQYGVILDISH